MTIILQGSKKSCSGDVIKVFCLMDQLIYGCKKNFGYLSIYGVYSKYIFYVKDIKELS